MDMLNFIFGRNKQQPQYEYVSHEGMALFYEQTMIHILNSIRTFQSASAPKITVEEASRVDNLRILSENMIKRIRQTAELESSKEKRNERIERDMKLNVNVYFEPLHSALVSFVANSHFQQQTVHSIHGQVISCVEKLFLYGYIETDIPYTGKIAVEGFSADKCLLIDVVMKAVCDCFSSLSVSKKSSAVQLQIVKAMLTAVTSTEIRGKSLRRAITTCMNIYLVNRDAVIQDTAKASLSQMINSVFHRMVDHQSDDDPSTVFSVDEEIDEQELELQQSATFEEEYEMTEVEIEIHEFVLGIIENIKRENDEFDEPQSNIEEQESPKKRKRAKSSEQTYLFQNPYEKDAFFLMRQLLQLSLRSKSGSLTARHISLEFILDLLRKYSEPILASGRGNQNLFIKDIKYILCLSLIKNAIAEQMALFELSLRIFEFLFKKGFVYHLLGELPTLFSSLILRCLASENASVEQKLIVLNVLQSCVVKDPQLLVNIYVNNDCSIGTPNTFESMLHTLCDLAKNTKFETGWINQQQETKLRNETLQTIAYILHSLIKFMDEHQVVPAESKYEQQKKGKLVFLKATETFSNKPEKGIAFLSELGLLPKIQEDSDDCAKQVARYLYDHRGVVFPMIPLGEYLGSNKPFQSKVRKEFTVLQNVRDLFIVTALRKYLTTFRLPGEGQIVGRFVEDFSNHYWNETKDLGTNPCKDETAVYFVVYSAIMLHTQWHNASSQFKWTEQQYISTLQGQNAGGDFPVDYLSNIYKDIVSTEFQMDPDEKNVPSRPETPTTSKSKQDTPLSIAKRKQVQFDEETLKAYKKEKVYFAQRASGFANKNEPGMFNALSRAHVSTMAYVISPDILSAVNELVKIHDDEKVVSFCLNLFKSSIKLCGRFSLEEQREALVSSLAKFTGLTQKVVITLPDNPNLQIPDALKPKNLECMKVLIYIADTEGNYLNQSWVHVIQCISELERLRGYSDSNQSDDKKMHRRSMSIDTLSTAYNNLASVIKKSIKSDTVDSLFKNSFKLSIDAVVYFVEALCKVSDRELSDDIPRKYCLDRILDVISANLTPNNNYERIRSIWPQIWKSFLFAHYMKYGVSDVVDNCSTVIKSLRQLSVMMLSCDLSLAQSETFQENYLKPFHEIIQQTDNNMIREEIIGCVGNLATKYYAKIESGWYILLHTLSWANRIVANQSMQNAKNPRAKKYTESAQIIQLGFEFVVYILKEAAFANVCRNNSFVACVSCLCAFARQQLLPHVAMRSIELLDHCAKQIVSQKVIPLSPIEEEAEQVRFSEGIELHSEIWRPILLQLSSSSGESRVEMRIRSIEILFKLLKENGQLFSKGFWRMIFQDVILPMFLEVTSENPPLPEAPSSPVPSKQESVNKQAITDSEWISTTCHKAMFCLVDLFAEYFDTISFMLEDVLKVISACFKRDRPTDILCQIGNGCIHQLVTLTGPRLTGDLWDLVCMHIGQAAITIDAASNFFQYHTSSVASSSSPSLMKSLSVECRAQTLLLDTCYDIIATQYENMDIRHVESFLQSLFTSYESARNLNTSQVFSQFSKNSSTVPLTEFITQETKALSLYMSTLFRIIADEREIYQERVQLAHRLLLPAIRQLLVRFLYQTGVNNEESVTELPYIGTFVNPDETQKLIPVVVKALEGFANFTDAQFEQYVLDFYPLFCDLIMQTNDKNGEIRTLVKKILLRCKTYFNFKQ